MATQQLYNPSLESKELTTSPTTTGPMYYFPLDPTGESCPTLRQMPTLWLRQSIPVQVSINARTLVLHHGVTSTTSGSIGKTVEDVETPVGALLSGTTAGESSEVDTFSHTTVGLALRDIRTCVRSTSLIRLLRTTPH